MVRNFRVCGTSLRCLRRKVPDPPRAPPQGALAKKGVAFCGLCFGMRARAAADI